MASSATIPTVSMRARFFRRQGDGCSMNLTQSTGHRSPPMVRPRTCRPCSAFALPRRRGAEAGDPRIVRQHLAPGHGLPGIGVVGPLPVRVAPRLPKCRTSRTSPSCSPASRAASVAEVHAVGKFEATWRKGILGEQGKSLEAELAAGSRGDPHGPPGSIARVAPLASATWATRVARFAGPRAFAFCRYPEHAAWSLPANESASGSETLPERASSPSGGWSRGKLTRAGQANE